MSASARFAARHARLLALYSLDCACDKPIELREEATGLECARCGRRVVLVHPDRRVA